MLSDEDWIKAMGYNSYPFRKKGSGDVKFLIRNLIPDKKQSFNKWKKKN